MASNVVEGGEARGFSANTYGGSGGDAYGGGIYVSGGSIDLTDTTLTNNLAQGGGGEEGGSNPSGCQCNTDLGICYGAPGEDGGNGGDAHGGGLYLTGTTATLDGVSITGNTADGGSAGSTDNNECGYGENGDPGNESGGGVYKSNNSSYSATNTTVSGNDPDNGP